MVSDINKRYGIKVKYDQFGNLVFGNSIDYSEIILIEIFETLALELVKGDKSHFRMIELGSNQSYYSLLFKAIVDSFKKTSDTVCVEPNNIHMRRGQEHFHMNNYLGAFFNFIVGSYDLIKEDLDKSNLPGGSEFLFKNKKKIVSLSEMLETYARIPLDFLHMDVDHSERAVLLSGEKYFRERKIDNIFISTHTSDLHNFCKDFLLSCGYTLRLEVTKMIVGYDSLLVFKNEVKDDVA